MAKNYRFESATYDEAKAYLKEAFEHIISTGRGVREFADFSLERFGDTFSPHLRRFLGEVHEGRVAVQGLTESARMAVLGRHLSAEERQAMIREAAYLRAERRGFTGGSPEEDWLVAEQEIDEGLLQQSGLLTKGRSALASAATSLEEELTNVKDTISGWLGARSDAATQAGKESAPAEARVAGQPAPAKKAAPAARKTAARRKSASKSAARKTTAGQASGRKKPKTR
ncbi:MAG: DUF2934 domain-containing protein [Gammaproteobacteria bacterium]|jgi:hypothetical protein